MKPSSLNQSSRYRSFISDRDRALEQIHSHSQEDTSRILNEALHHAIEMITFQYTSIPEHHFFTALAQHALHVIDLRLEHIFNFAAQRITSRIMRTRKNVYLLSATGESEAIGQAQGKLTRVHLSHDHLTKVMNSKTANDESLLSRVHLALSRIKRDILDAVQTARVMEESRADMLTRVKRVFPKAQIYKRPPKILKSLKEAKKKDDPDFLSEPLLDDSEWDDMLEEYKQTELPASRFYNEPIDVEVGEPELEERYAWDIEKELTHDFVDKVRQGQVEAANQAGIQEFVWIAIIDDKTDECCVWRDGLTTSEIEAELEKRGDDDDCEDATVPPAHFNCRCRLAPVGELPERVESNLGDFEEWLNS